MSSGPTKASIHADLPNRFCYWQGDSREPYLFSRIEPKDLHNFNDCILLLCLESSSDHPKVFWVDQISSLSPNLFHSLQQIGWSSVGLYVHLLAGSHQHQLDIIKDLSADGLPLTLSAVA